MRDVRVVVKLSAVVISPQLSPNVRSPARTVLVTGSAKRLGREIALTLARAGWQVAVHYRGSVDEARQTVADCARLAHGAPPSRPIWLTRPRCARCCRG